MYLLVPTGQAETPPQFAWTSLVICRYDKAAAICFTDLQDRLGHNGRTFSAINLLPRSSAAGVGFIQLDCGTRKILWWVYSHIWWEALNGTTAYLGIKFPKVDAPGRWSGNDDLIQSPAFISLEILGLVCSTNLLWSASGIETGCPAKTVNSISKTNLLRQTERSRRQSAHFQITNSKEGPNNIQYRLYRVVVADAISFAAIDMQ